eukprot:353356-Chlamydomonas_euryale.AAC.2
MQVHGRASRQAGRCMGRHAGARAGRQTATCAHLCCRVFCQPALLDDERVQAQLLVSLQGAQHKRTHMCGGQTRVLRRAGQGKVWEGRRARTSMATGDVWWCARGRAVG